MELNEALRRIVVGHWRLLLVLTLIPVLVVGALTARTKPSYAATARVQASSSAPTTSTEADAVLNRAQGIATSTSVLQKTLQQAHVSNRSPAEMAHEVAVTRIGLSAVLDITVTDRDARVATATAAALAPQLVTFLNGSADAPKAALVGKLTAQENALLDQRVKTAAALALAATPTDNARLAAQLVTIDQQLTNVQASLRQLQSSGVAASTAVVVSEPSAAVPSRASRALYLGLAALLGLTGGLLAASVLEVVRPRVADAGAFGREIDAPLLGRLVLRGGKKDPALAIDHETLVGAKRAITHAKVDTVVLTGPDTIGRLRFVAHQLERRLAFDAPPAGAILEQSPWNGDGDGVSSNGNGDGSLPSNGGPVGRVPPAASHRPAPAGTAQALAAAPAVHALGTATDSGPQRPIRVRTLTDVDDVSDRCRQGLIVLMPNLVRYSEVRRVRHLIAATGWPAVGVLGVSRRRLHRRGRGDGPDKGEGQLP